MAKSQTLHGENAPRRVWLFGLGLIAMTALAYLREAAEQGTLSSAKVEQVRSFFKILPKQPHLLFAFSA